MEVDESCYSKSDEQLEFIKNYKVTIFVKGFEAPVNLIDSFNGYTTEFKNNFEKKDGHLKIDLTKKVPLSNFEQDIELLKQTGDIKLESNTQIFIKNDLQKLYKTVQFKKEEIEKLKSLILKTNSSSEILNIEKSIWQITEEVDNDEMKIANLREEALNPSLHIELVMKNNLGNIKLFIIMTCAVAVC